VILIGQFDSPFVRRVGIALTLYHMPFAHEPWSTFGDRGKIEPYNPLTRVPTLVLADGEVLIDSHMMLDYLDNLVGAARALYPRAEPERHRALKVAALATGICDKTVSLFYEKRLHAHASDIWVKRCHGQIAAALAALEVEREGSTSAYWFGEQLGHADIAVACAVRFLSEAHPGLVDVTDLPGLATHAARCEALPVFEQIYQEFIPPA
jgi:glutathione S-transferase